MKKYLVLLYMMALQSQAFAQPPDFVKLRGRQFFDGYGQPFYPLMMNYGVDYHFYNSQYWIDRNYEYGTDNDNYENTDPQTAIAEMNTDLDIIVDMGFNMVRPVFTPEWDAVNQVFYLKAREPTTSGNYTDHLITFLPGDAAFTRYLDDLEFFVNMAGTKGLYTMVNGALGDITDPAAKIPYFNFLQALGNRFANNKFLAFYDILNEPLWKYDYANAFNNYSGFSKEQTCILVQDYYDQLNASDGNHMISGGNLAEEDVLMFDLSILKLDFSQPHLYSEMFTKHDNYNLTNRINRVKGNTYWVYKNCPMPWINGETGLPTSDNYTVSQLPKDPFIAGNDNDQNQYAIETLEATRNHLGSGYFWWNFQEGAWPPNMPVWGYGVVKLNADVTNLQPADKKPAYYTFQNYLNAVGQPPPISSAPLTEPDNYYDPFTYSLLNPNHTGSVAATLIDQNNEPVGHAFVRGLNFLSIISYSPLKIKSDWIYTFSNDLGYFDLIPYNSEILGDNRIIFVAGSAAGADKLSYSSGSAAQVTTPSQITLKRSKFEYDAIIDENVIALSTKNFKAWNSISMNSQIEGESAIRARQEINLTDGFHAYTGSDVHIYPDQTFGECSEYARIQDGNKISNQLNDETNSTQFKNIEITFKNEIGNQFDVVIEPNPTSNFTTIHLENTEDKVIKTIMLKDHLGRILYTHKFTGYENNLQLASYAKGIYFIEIIINGQRIVKKIIHS